MGYIDPGIYSRSFRRRREMATKKKAASKGKLVGGSGDPRLGSDLEGGGGPKGGGKGGVTKKKK
jgi:hypothetical protein